MIRIEGDKMPITIKTGAMKYKKPNGEYDGFNAIAQESIPDDYTELSGNVADLKSFIGPTETTSTASTGYLVDRFLIYNGKLYQVTARISAGDTLIPGTNITPISSLSYVVYLLKRFAETTLAGRIDNLESILAQPYTAGDNYVVGEYVFHDHDLYACKYGIQSAGEFNGSQWTKITETAGTLNDLYNRISMVLQLALQANDGYVQAMAMVAPAFSESNAYSAGDSVTYNGILYTFTANHAAGAWIGTDVAAVPDGVAGKVGSLSTLGAAAGQVPIADGNSSWAWGDVFDINNAKGDGVTDDTIALSEAFNRSNVVINGLNKRYKIGEIVITEQSNILIENFIFYHGISITLKHCENVVFRNCIWDTFQDGGLQDKNVQCVILTTMHVGSSEWVEENNWRIDEVCKNITFDHCQFLATHYTESTPSLYTGTKPHYNTGMCLRLEGVDGLKVIDCYFTQNRGNACIQQNCYAPLGDFEIRNNLFYLNCYGGIELYRYTGTSSYPTRIIQGNRFIGHGLGYLPWEYLEQFDENERGVGTAVLLGGNVARIQNEVAYCSVCDNHFEDNNESSIEGWQWNPVRNNTIIGNGVLQTAESVTEMKQKYKISYQLYVRKNPSQNPIYMGQYTDIVRYPSGETRVIENNTIARSYGTRNPIIIRGYFHEQIIIRNNTMTDEALSADSNSKYAHFLSATFYNGLIWENNIGMKPYFNTCVFNGGEYKLDELNDIYDCTFTSQAFTSLSKIDRFQQLRSARFCQEFASLRDNNVSLLSNGKPELGYYKRPVIIEVPTPDWSIKDESGYNNGYVFGGSDNPTILDTQMSLGATDQNWTIYVDTTTSGDNGAGNNTYLIKLLTFSDDNGTLSLEFGSRYENQPWTWLFPNAVWNYDKTYQLDGSSAMNFLRPGRTSSFVLRHKAGSGQIEVFAKREDTVVSQFSELNYGTYPFTSGTAGTLRFGGVPNTNRPLSYYNGTINDASVFEKALSDSQVSLLMLGTDIAPHTTPSPVYNIANETGYEAGVGLVMDGTKAIDTGIALLENTNDFTIISKFKFDNMRGENGKPNFSFFPVFSAMSASMPTGVHTGYTDKGFDVGLTMQDGRDLSTLARGGFISFRRDWRYTNSFSIDDYNYSNYYNLYYTIIIRRKDNVITVYDGNLLKLGELTGDYATSLVTGNLTIGAQMGYDSNYTNFFKGIISDFRVYNTAVDLDAIENEFPSISDNEVSNKGAVTYHLSNKNNSLKSARYAIVEINYDLGEYNSAEYTVQYPKAFGIKLDKIYDEVIWVPCSSSKRIAFTKLCKWDAIYGPFEDWNIEIINPGTVPGLKVTIIGVKVLLLSKEEAIADSTDATDFNISWDSNLTGIAIGGTSVGYVQYVPDDANSGLTLTASSDDTSVATVTTSGQDVTITGIASGSTFIHVSIPYGTERIYSVSVGA
jgi:hypothetical protein